MRLTIAALFVLFSFTAAAQCFNARDFVLSVGHSGAGVTKFTANDSAGYRTQHEEGGFNFYLRGEYGLSPWLSVNLSVSLTPLITQTLFDEDATCYIYDAGPGLGYHIPWKNRWIDLEGDAGIGYTRFFQSDLGEEKIDIKAISVFGDFHPRVYFTKKQRLGGFLYYRFNLYSGSGEVAKTGFQRRLVDVQGYTHAFGIGWFYRFGNWNRPDTDEDPL